MIDVSHSLAERHETPFIWQLSSWFVINMFDPVTVSLQLRDVDFNAQTE